MNVDIFLIGGHYTHFHESTVGVYTEKMVSQFHFDHAFLDALALSWCTRWLYNDDIDTVPVKEIAMKCSNKNYLLADASKFGKTSFCRLAPLSAFDGVIVTCPPELSAPLPSNFIVVQDE